MSPSSIIGNIYDVALILSGLLAFGAIVFGAIKYTIAAGNPSEQHEGKEWITQALLGVLLLFGAYLILHTINPRLVQEGDLPSNLPKVNIGNPVNTNVPPRKESCGPDPRRHCFTNETCVQENGFYICLKPGERVCGPYHGACGAGRHCVQLDPAVSTSYACQFISP